MFTVPKTLFKGPHALLMVPPMLFMVPTPNDHGSTNSNFVQGSNTKSSWFHKHCSRFHILECTWFHEHCPCL